MSPRALDAGVAILDEQAADDLAQMRLAKVAAIPRLLVVIVEDPHVLLGRQGRERVVVSAREQDLDELLGQRRRQLGVDRRLRHTIPPNADIGSQANALPVGVERIGPDRHTTRVVVLDDHARRSSNSASSCWPASRSSRLLNEIGLPPQLRDLREHVGGRADLLVVGGALVRVLTIGELEHLLERAHEQRREVLVLLLEPAGDRGVIAGGVGERRGGQRSRGSRGERWPSVSRSSSSTAS